MLILVQDKNLLLGRTTYERFAKSNQSILTREGSVLLDDSSHIPELNFKNCRKMCCEEEEGEKEDVRSSSTTETYMR